MRLPCGFLFIPTTRAWWTGKDSNLRSPQGAADLQSAGFSHSPTRPVKSFGIKNPIPRKLFGTRTTSPELFLQQLAGILSKNTKRTRVKRHQPVCFSCQDSLRPRSPAKFLVELAEGIEPPTL